MYMYVNHVYIVIIKPNFQKKETIRYNFDQMLTLYFCHFVQEVNEIWYPGRAINSFFDTELILNIHV